MVASDTGSAEKQNPFSAVNAMTDSDGNLGATCSSRPRHETAHRRAGNQPNLKPAIR